MRLGSSDATIGMGACPPLAACCCFCISVAPEVGCSGGGFCELTSCLTGPRPFLIPLLVAIVAGDFMAILSPIRAAALVLLFSGMAADAAFLALALPACKTIS